MAKLDSISYNGTKYELAPEIAPLFSPNSAYTKGDCVIHEAVLYKFTANHAAGAWTGNDAEAIEVADRLNKISDSVALEFNASTSYTAGQYVYRNGVLYRFTSDHTGAWTGTDAEVVTVGGELTGSKADLLQIQRRVYDKNILFTITGKYINSAGGITNAPTYSCGDYIPVKSGDVIKYKLLVGNNTTAIGYYPSNTSLTGFEKIVSGTGGEITGNVTIASNGYIRIASTNDFISNNNPYIRFANSLDQMIDDVASDVADLETDLSALDSEIDTTNDAVQAVSNEVTEINGYLAKEKHIVINDTTITLTWIEGSYYNLSTGEITSLASYARTDKYPCKQGDVIDVPNHAGQIVFFKSDGTVSYKSGVKTYTTFRAAPANTIAFALNNNDSTVRTATVTQHSANDDFVVTTLNAPARVICDTSMFISHKYANTSNGLIATEGDAIAAYYCLANYPVKANHKYRTETQTQIVFYDSDLTFISSLLPGGASGNTGTRVEMDFVTPATCAYISINSLSSHELLFDVDDYDVVGYITNPRKLSGLTVLSFGDSITGNYAYGDNISSFVEDSTGAKTYNCGFGGCRMEKLDENGSAAETAALTNPFAMCELVDQLALPDTDPDKWDTQDTAAAAFEASPRFNRIIKFRLGILKQIDITDIDIVTIAYGTNEIGYTQDNPNNKYDKYTFGGATRYAVEKLLELNPNLRIVLLTPIYRHDVSSSGYDSDSYVDSSTGLSMADNINTLKAVGLEYKIPVIDMYHDLGINAENYLAYFGDDDEPDDGTHINSYGRKMFGLRLAGELNRLF